MLFETTFFARADFVRVHHLQRRGIPISIASPVPEAVEIFRSFVRNLAPDFTHYIRVAHEDTSERNRQPIRRKRLVTMEAPVSIFASFQRDEKAQ